MLEVPVGYDYCNRREASGVLGSQLAAVPPHVAVLNETSYAPARSAKVTSNALEEMLILARTDGMIVWDLAHSTYSGVAAAWATHRAGGQPAARSHPWLGVFAARTKCAHVPDYDVEPFPEGLSKRWAESQLSFDV